jgi:dienelactone hydrolase
MCIVPWAALAEAPKAFVEGRTPQDSRLGNLKDLNGYFPFAVSESPSAWQERAQYLRRQMLVALGLWPMPKSTPANAVIHGKVEREDYTVEKVYFESFPGHFVTGNLYRPKGRTGKLAGVLCPHGHWANGRFHDHGIETVKKEIASGGEKFEVGGRHPLQSRCVTLARLGCVVFHYDMVGYADSQQIAHRPGSREHMNTPTHWGYFSPQAELRLQTMMGLQTYNSIRALDVLLSLPEVDPERIGVTGASGGGTQTFILCAIDPRPKAAFPAVMVSTAMQGGCTCENAPYLRLGTGNVEIAALFAPKPLGLTAANDWTKEMETKGFPELRQHYAMLGAPQHVMLSAHVEYGHNYNYVSRTAMYGWFNEHLRLGHGTIEETDFVPLTQAEMSVWDQAHPRPPSGDDYERSLLRYITQEQNEQLAALVPKDSKSLAEYRRVIGGAFEILLSRKFPALHDLEWEKTSETDKGSYIQFGGLLRYKPAGEEIAVVFLHPKEWKKQIVVWPHEQGKTGLFADDGIPRPAVQNLLRKGFTIATADLLFQGELIPPGQEADKARLAQSGRDRWKSYAGYTFGYNQSLFAQRASDILSLVSFVRNAEDDGLKAEKVHLLAFDGAGPWAVAALAAAGEAIDRAAIDTGGFRFDKLTAIDDVNFVPGSVKYGDLPGWLALAAPHELWLAGEGNDVPQIVRATYAAAGSDKNITLYTEPDEGEEAAAVAWLMR